MRDAAEQRAPDTAIFIFEIELPVLGKGDTGNAQLFFRFATRGFQQLLIGLDYTACGRIQHAG